MKCGFRHPSIRGNNEKLWGETNFQGWEGFKFMRNSRSLKENEISIGGRETFGDVRREKEEAKAII